MVHNLPRSTSKVIKWAYDWVVVSLSQSIFASHSQHIESIVQYTTVVPTQNISPAG